MRKLKSIEKDILNSSACILLYIEAWEKFILSIPDIKNLGSITQELIPESLKFIKNRKNYFALDKIIAMEKHIFIKNGEHTLKKDFFSNMEILKQIDDKSIIKNIAFSEYIFIEDQAINLLKENIKAI